MSQFHSNPTEFKEVNGKLVKVKEYPTMNLATKDSRVLAQGGNIWHPNGTPIPKEKWPKWVIKELDKCSDETLQYHGFDMWWREKKEPPKRGRPRIRKYDPTKPVEVVNESDSTMDS